MHFLLFSPLFLFFHAALQYLSPTSGNQRFYVSQQKRTEEMFVFGHLASTDCMPNVELGMT